NCEEMDDDLVAMVEEHRFEPVTLAEWRNARLDFGSLAALLRSLEAPPPWEGLKASEDALDEVTLRALAADEGVGDGPRARPPLSRLWHPSHTPASRNPPQAARGRLVRTLSGPLTEAAGGVPDDWMAGQFKQLARRDGEIAALPTRLA